MKKQSNLSRLLTIAGSYRYLTYASWILSAISALIALVPYYFIWQVMREVLEVAPDFSRAQNLTYNGWMAVMFAVIAVLVYIAGLMCSHLGAFRIATNLRLQSMNHIVKLPLDLRNILAAVSCAKSSMNPALLRKPIWHTSSRTVRTPSQLPAVFWFCCLCLTGGWVF